MLRLCNWFICSLAGGNKPRRSSSLNKDAARLPHGVWKANLVQTVGQAAERGLSVSFQLSWKLPPVTHQELHLCVFTEHRKSAHLCQVQPPLTHQSELPFSICASAYPITISLSVQQMNWYCACFSFPHVSNCSRSALLLPSLVFIPLEHFTASTRASQLRQWLQHQHPPLDEEVDRKTKRERERNYSKIQQHIEYSVWQCMMMRVETNK